MEQPTQAQWRSELSNGRTQIFADYKKNRNGRKLLSSHAKLVDVLLKKIWHKSALKNLACLIAVGGYGRQELFPYSDIDILILFSEEKSSTLNITIEKFIGLLWDIGLEVGHSVRDINSCLKLASEDITITTNLLDQRYLAGDFALQKQLTEQFYTHLDAFDFIEKKILEKQHRHTRYLGIANNLEPNIKEGPGGLRDVDTIFWISKVLNLGNNVATMAKNKLLSKSEQRQLEQNIRQLKTLRIDIHLAAKRHEERLLFDLQQNLANSLGFSNQPDKIASEQLMQLYFKAARTLLQFGEILLPNLLARFYSPLPHHIEHINKHFYSINGHLELKNNKLFENQPANIFKAFLLFQGNVNLLGFAPKLLQALWRARSKINAAFRKDEVNRRLFLKIFHEPRLSRALRIMNLYGVLGKYLPAFGRIIGRMQHDLFHVYTVDEHILMVVRNLRRLSIPKFAHEHPFLSGLMVDFPKPELLYIAGLFHDIAKGCGSDHAQAGMLHAQNFCQEHKINQKDSSLIIWLVGQHLHMSLTTQKQDIYNPQVVKKFAEQTGSVLRLNALYLLTFADIRATSPKVWNGWKASLLESLYLSTKKVLQHGNQDISSALDERKIQAQKILTENKINQGSVTELWSKLDSVYFLRHDANEIAWHAEILNQAVLSNHALVRTRINQQQSGVQVLVYAQNKNGLFAKLCAFFSKMNYDIADAKIYTTLHNYALDTFIIFTPEHLGHNSPELLELIEQQLLEYLNKTDTSKPVLLRSSRRLRYSSIRPKVLIRADDNDNCYILSIVAGDSPGMLARVVQLLADYKISVHHAKIMTFGERAEDSLLLKGSFLFSETHRIELEQKIIKILTI